jgi:hypothetical protein
MVLLKKTLRSPFENLRTNGGAVEIVEILVHAATSRSIIRFFSRNTLSVLTPERRWKRPVFFPSSLPGKKKSRKGGFKPALPPDSGSRFNLGLSNFGGSCGMSRMTCELFDF